MNKDHSTIMPPDLAGFSSAPLTQAAGILTGEAFFAGLIGESADTIRPLAEIERAIIERAIELCDGHIPRAARCLGLSPSTLYRKKARWI